MNNSKSQHEERPLFVKALKKKARPKFQVQLLPSIEKHRYECLFDLYIVNFLYNDTWPSSIDEDKSIAELWRRHIAPADAEDNAPSVEVAEAVDPYLNSLKVKVKQQQCNIFNDLRNIVITQTLKNYGLDEIEDNIERATKVGQLLTNLSFIYPIPEVPTPILTLMSKVRKERFFHQAIIKTLALWLFVKKPNGLGYKMSSDDEHVRKLEPQLSRTRSQLFQ